MGQDFCTVDFSIKTKERTFDVSEVLLTVVDLNKYLAENNIPDLVALGGAGIDAAQVLKIRNDLGLFGEAYVKVIKGKHYLILKGTAAKRPVLRGTKYLLSNPKIAHIAITAKKLAKGAAKANVLSVIAYTSFEIVEMILRDPDARLTTLLGKIASSVTKAAIASAVGFIAGVALGSIVSVAAGPVILGIFVALATSAGLEYLDKKFKITEKLIIALEEIADNRPKPLETLAKEIKRWESYLINKAINKVRLYH